jgi:hypothetical protein
MDAPDLKYKPQINEYEMNPFLLFDPALRDRHFYEIEHGVVHMSESD